MKVTDDNNVSISASSGESYVVVLSGSKYAEVTVPSGAAKTVSTATSSSVSVSVLPSSSTSVSIAPVSRSVDVFGKGAKGDKGEKGEPGTSGSGSSFLTEDLTVTNPVGEILDNQLYPQLTELEDIITDILTKYDDPKVVLPEVTFSDFLTDVDYVGNKVEFGSQLKVKEVVIESSFMENMVFGSTMSIKVTNPFNELTLLTLSPTLVMPTYGWGYFPQSSVVETSHIQSLDYLTLGKKQVKIEWSYLENPTDTFNASLGSFTYDFFIGKKIRCFTSLASDPRALNLASGFVDGVNVYDPSSESLLTDTLGVDANEIQYEEMLVDFESEDQEVIVSFSGVTQIVSDRERYLIIELPNEFKIDEAAATTAGSGVYSLNNSIVYLGNQSSAGQYTRNDMSVKYYRSKIPGAFDNKIKLDLKIKLDN